MDCRVTTSKETGFLQLLQAAYDSKNKVNLLIDSDGLTRIEGVITCLESENDQMIIALENGQRIPLMQLVAVNGIFSSDFSEC